MAQTSLKDMPLSEIEKGYWACDYAAMQTLLGFDEAASCSFIFEELKARKFKGSFAEFHKWWMENKATEHAKLAKKR